MSDAGGVTGLMGRAWATMTFGDTFEKNGEGQSECRNFPRTFFHHHFSVFFLAIAVKTPFPSARGQYIFGLLSAELKNDINPNLLTERLLHFIWQFQYYNQSELSTVGGEKIEVIHPGNYNTNQGPDFSDAKIRIDNAVWAGSVELHIRTSDWERHHHHGDSHYKNVVLHVVWEDDAGQGMLDAEQARVPVFELRERVSKILMGRYEQLMHSAAFIPCEKRIGEVKDITWKNWMARLLTERLYRKSNTVESFLHQTNFHWEESFWWLLARNFGMYVNADAFEILARSISINVLAKQKHQIHQLEAILLGQAGLLEEDFQEDYPLMLQKEYRFQQKKHGIRPVPAPFLFLRMRPGNFPTIRLAQLAMLIHQSAHLFSVLKDMESLDEARKLFDVTANDYWHYHYRLDEPSGFKQKHLGDLMIDNLIINTVVPVLFTYGYYHKDQRFTDRAIQWLEQTTGEKNSVTDGFSELGIENSNAFDSQALLHLRTEYCIKKRCLECPVGSTLLKQLG